MKFCLAVATTLPGYRTMRELVGVRDNVVFSCGVHPLNQDEAYDVEELRRLAAEEGVVAMGRPARTILHAGNETAAAGVLPPSYPHWPRTEQAGHCAYP